MKAELESEYADWIDFNTISLDPNVAEVFGNDKGFSLLLRPENYIGLILTESSPEEIRNYLGRHVGLRR